MNGICDKIRLPFDKLRANGFAKQLPNFKRGSLWKNLLKEQASWV